MTTYTAKFCGDTYTMRANFAQASCPVEGDAHGRQVADFRHSPEAAMRSMLEESVQMSGDDPDECSDEIDAAIESMTARDDAMIAMADMLERHGAAFTGNNVDDEAQGWLDDGFDAGSADDWCEIGVWDAATAAQLRDAGLSPEQVREACERLIEDAGDDARDEYTDGDPIYSACNNDTSIDVLIDAAKIDA